jgi:hypothetical protein
VIARTLPRLAALAILAAGAVHFKLWLADGYSSISVIGPLFLLNAISALLIAVALLALPRALLVLLAAAGYAASTLVFFAISVTHGLFGFREVLFAPAQEAAGIAEIVALLLLLPALAVSLRRPLRGRAGGPRLGAAGVGAERAEQQTDRRRAA